MGNEFLLGEFQRIEKSAHRRLAVTPPSLMLPFVVSFSVKERHAVALLPRRGFEKIAKICMRK